MTAALLPALGAVAILLVILVVVLLRVSMRLELRSDRLAAVQRGAGVDQVSSPRSLSGLPLRALAAIGGWLTRSGVLPARTVRELEQTLLAAGFRGGTALAVFVGAKALMLPGVPLLTVVLLDLAAVRQPLFSYLVGAAVILGLLLPDLIAKRMRKRYLTSLERGMPDALDLMIICTEAGLSLETTVERVAEEIRPASAAVATEFSICASELRILPDRRTALANLGTRTGLEIARRLGMTLAQTIQFGTPIAQALRTLAAEMRQEQLVRFEERAAKLPVLLTVPMIICILPTLFLIVAGPAMLQVMRTW